AGYFMKNAAHTSQTRRTFIARTLGGAAATFAGPTILRARANTPFRAGEAQIDSTPPTQIELAGFHYKAGESPRYITDIRQKTSVRSLVLRKGDTLAVIIAVDIADVSPAMATRVQQAVAAKTGIPAANVRLCASHTHSMPTFAYWRQWGTTPEA